MSKNNSVVPQARAALDQFKMEAAREVGVNLKHSYRWLDSGINYILLSDNR